MNLGGTVLSRVYRSPAHAAQASHLFVGTFCSSRAPSISDCERDLAPEVSFELGTQELRSWNELGSAK
jgi:hypothetical protein